MRINFRSHKRELICWIVLSVIMMSPVIGHWVAMLISVALAFLATMLIRKELRSKRNEKKTT